MMNVFLRRRPLAAACKAVVIALAFVALVPTSFAGEAVDLGKVTLRVGDQTGATQSKLRAAGLLDDVPYKIEWSVFAAAVSLHEALKADAVDTGLAGDAPTISAIAGGSPIQIVAAWTNGGEGVDLIVPHDSPIRSVADLRGACMLSTATRMRSSRSCGASEPCPSRPTFSARSIRASQASISI